MSLNFDFPSKSLIKLFKILVNDREFCKMAKKIFIYPSEEVKKMRPDSKFPSCAEDGGSCGGCDNAAASLVKEP